MSEHPGRDEEVTLRLTWDGEVDAGYLYLTEIGHGEAVTQRMVANPVEGRGEVILDFDKEGRLLGIEMLGRAVLPPSLRLTTADPRQPSREPSPGASSSGDQ